MRSITACIAVGLLVAGCAGQVSRPPATEVTRIPEEGDWFCQQSRTGEGWECVQDPELAENPRPERLPPGPAAAPPEVPEAPATPLAPRGPDSPPPPGLTEPPPRETPLGALPSGHHAVQLVAMHDRESTEAFADRHQLDGTRIVQVERDGQIFHVLLLGVYESLHEAEQAVAELPLALQEIGPWIRPVASLQLAMARADAPATSMAGSAAP